MVKNMKVTGNAVSVPVGIGMGVTFSVLLTLILAAAETWLLLNGRVDEALTGYLSMGVLAVSVFTGTVLSANKIKR